MDFKALDFKAQICLALLAAIIWFALLGHRDLIDPDEGRYAEIPREMIAAGDWLTPRLNGYKYFEKPPLQYWMTAVSFELFGQSNATARLWSVAIGFACALFVWFVGARLFDPQSGFYAFVFTIGGALYSVLAHILTLDTTLTFFLVAGIGCLAIAQSRRGDRKQVRNWMLAGWVALAGAVMTKGLIGLVLPGGAVVVYSLWQRDWVLWKNLHLGKGLLLFLVLVAPWFAAMSMEHDEFARFFFIHEHFERYTTTVHNRDGSIFYFVPFLVLGIAPWLASAARAMIRPGFGWKTGEKNQFDALRLLWVFIVLTFVFFSLGDSKLPSYIQPIMPILALLAGRCMTIGCNPRGNAWVMALLASLLLVLGIVSTRFAGDNFPVEYLLGFRGWIIAAAVALYLGAALLFAASRHVLRNTALAGIFALLGFQIIGWGYQELAPLRSSADIAEQIEAQGLADVPIYSISKYPHSLSFYLGKTIRLVDHTGELEMGIKAEPDRKPATFRQFIERWQQETQAVALFKLRDYDKYRTLGLPMRVIYEGPRKIVVARR
ncbi:MAG: glycosyltransferase family 39 protein [Gammaproteobacteria bacterium]